jgi:hypothetical protein
MRPVRQLIAPLALLLAAGSAGTQAHAGDAVSYRDAYRAMVVFEKYGGPKNLLVNQLQVLSRERSPMGEGLQLTLAGKTTQVNLPLDPLGRTVFPLQKAAYDENASLVVNGKDAGFTLRPQVSIALRADGLYEMADLRAACAQALGYARYVDASQRARECAGVRFVFPKKAEGGARLRRPHGTEQLLPLMNAEADDGFPAVTYRFTPGTERGQVATANAPLAILPLFE